ncbi:MAG: DUF4019 domain-containing protein [Terriglobales bacterium]
MKPYFAILLLLTTAFAQTKPVPAATEKKQQEAITAASKAAAGWLSLLDFGKYNQAWDASSQIFKAQVKREEWNKSIVGLRAPMGKAGARNATAVGYQTKWAHAPDGQYVLIEYNTKFQNGSATEMIALALEKDGAWRVGGYSIKRQ